MLNLLETMSLQKKVLTFIFEVDNIDVDRSD